MNESGQTLAFVAYACLVCDWVISEEEHDQARVDFECPGCGTRTFSQFDMGVLVPEGNPY